MKNLRNKLLAGVFAFIIGVTAFYTVSKLKPEVFDIFSANPASQTPLTEIEEIKLSEPLEVRFVGFSTNEDSDFTLAKFEVTNNTSRNAYYDSYSKTDFPFPEMKRDGSIVQNNLSYCGTGIERQTLKPGESVTFSVPKDIIARESTKDSWRETDQPTQVGFPIQLGEDGFYESRNKQRTYFWSEEIKFPN